MTKKEVVKEEAVETSGSRRKMRKKTVRKKRRKTMEKRTRRGKREACVREVRRGEGGEEASWPELGKVRAPTGKYHSLH